MRRILIFPVLILLSCSATFSLEFEDERRERSYGLHNSDDDPFGIFNTRPFNLDFGHRRTAESDDSSEENEDKSTVFHGSGSVDDLGIIVDDHDSEVMVSTEKDKKSNSSDENDSTDVLFNHPIDPFFNNPFFNVFGLGHGSIFPGFNVPQSIPWWRGPNVCTERKEEITDWNSPSSSSSNESSEEQKAGLRKTTTSHGIGFHFSFNTCVEKSNKRTCTSVADEQGRKKTLTVTQQCCRGYGRKKNSKSSNILMPCEEVHLRSLIETSERLNGLEFIRAAQKNDADNELRQNVTLFLPTDVVFTEFAEQLLESNLVVLPGSRARRAAEASGITTKTLIMNHIVPDVISMEDVENEQLLVTKFENRTIRMNIFPRPPGARKDDESSYLYTANCAPVSKMDQEAENGIVHIIDRVLMPVTKSLMELIREREDMAVLQTVLDKTDLAKQLDNADRTFTLFAPTDKAFEKLDPHVRRSVKEGKGCALNILKNHILDMTFCSAAVVEGAKTSAMNEMGEKMTMERINAERKNSEPLTEADDLAEKKSILINGKSQIIETDTMATNGVMHVIDTLLPTDSSLPLTSILESRNLTLFKTLLVLNGIDDMVDSYENVSVFAPTNSALQSTEWAKKIESDPDSLKGNEKLTKFLQYHIAKPLIKTCDLSERLLETESGDSIRVNLYSTHSAFSNIFNRATVNCARLVHFDDDSCGSVLHQIDRPIQPPSQNILEALKANEQYSMFVELLETANLTSLLADTNRSLTVLVPKNDVFTEVQEYFSELTTKGNEKKLENIVKLHIIDDALCCAGIVQSQWPFIRLVQTINDVNLKINRNRRPMIQNAGITKCDIMATNGIIHEVNDVINTRQMQRSPVSQIAEDSDDSSLYSSLPRRPFQDFFPF